MIRREGDFIRTNPLITAQVRLRLKFKKMGYYRDLPHWVRHIPHRLRGGAVLNKLKLKGLMAFWAFFLCSTLQERGSRRPCTKKAQRKALSFNLFAEREGFEPPDPLRSTVFKTAAFDHSAISPMSNFISPTPVFCEVERKGKDNF